MERVLSKARQATVYSKRKPTVERKCAVSHLSFIALERAFVAADEYTVYVMTARSAAAATATTTRSAMVPSTRAQARRAVPAAGSGPSARE